MDVVGKACLLVGIFVTVAWASAGGPQDAEGEPLCGGEHYEVAGGRGGVPPTLTLTVDGVTGAFLVDYGATRSSLSAAAFGGPDGASRRASLPLPGLGEGDFVLSIYDPRSGEIGILGADVLSRLTVQLSSGEAFFGTKTCDAKVLRADGFIPVSEKGFFSANAADVDPAQPNVPVVFARLGEVLAFAQVDTGYGDAVYPRSVDINQKLYDTLVASGAALTKVGGVGVRTCEGIVESRPVYSAHGVTLAIENERGAAIARTDHFFLIVKAANGCGGIGGMKIPAAQLGASFLDLFGETIFDGKAGTVWLRSNAEAAPAQDGQ